LDDTEQAGYARVVLMTLRQDAAGLEAEAVRAVTSRQDGVLPVDEARGVVVEPTPVVCASTAPPRA
jgi:hypothetical protein